MAPADSRVCTLTLPDLRRLVTAAVRIARRARWPTLSLEGAEGVLHLRGGGGWLHLQTSAVGNLPCSALWPSTWLRLVRHLPGSAKVHITRPLSRRIQLEAEGLRVMVPLVAADLPQAAPPDAPEVTTRVWAADLLRVVQAVAPARARAPELDPHRRYLRGVLLELHSGGVRAVATDGGVLHYADTGAPTTPRTLLSAVLLTRQDLSAVRQLCRLDPTAEVTLGGPWLPIDPSPLSVSLVAGLLSVTTAHASYRSRCWVQAAGYPDYRRVISPPHLIGAVTLSRAGLLAALAAVPPSEGDGRVVLEVSGPTALRVSTTAGDPTWRYRAQVDAAEVTGAPAPVAVGAARLARSVRSTQSEIVQLVWRTDAMGAPDQLAVESVTSDGVLRLISVRPAGAGP